MEKDTKVLAWWDAAENRIVFDLNACANLSEEDFKFVWWHEYMHACRIRRDREIAQFKASMDKAWEKILNG